MKEYTIVEVEWGDAFIDTDDFNDKDALKTEPVYRKTVGYFIAQNKHGLILATDVYKKDSEGVAGKLFIPWGMVDYWREV